jgi:hypothetical protein
MRHLVLALLVVGCASTERVVVRAPDGGNATLVSGPSLGAVMAEADEGCPFGYDILDREQTASMYGYQGTIATHNRTEMLVRCHRRGK